MSGDRGEVRLAGDAPVDGGEVSLAGDAPAEQGEPRLAYNGLALDRAAATRGDAAWVATVLGRPTSRLIPFWREKCLTRGRPGAGYRPAILAAHAPAAAAALAAATHTVLLGLDGRAGIFAIDLSRLRRAEALGLAGATDAVDVRAMFAALDEQQAATLGYALGILRWHRDQRFCGACGHPAASCHGGTQRRCTGADCGRLLFPRIEPSVIALVEGPGPVSRCLLARHRGATPGAFATLAGFVEIGEGLEDAVRREVAEETGVQLGKVSYQASQAWPFPAGLMIGFRARAISEAICVDRAELDEARWFTRAEVSAMLARHPARPDSIESHLIGGWLRERA
jgi:NAD+ diphosphatase